MNGKTTVTDPTPARRLPVLQENRRLQRVEALVAAGRVEEALAHLRKLVQDVPDSSRGYVRIATLLREGRRSEEACAILETAVLRLPRCPVSREALAEVCLEVGRLDDVVTHCAALLDIRPRSLSAREMLSTVYLQRGQLDRALSLLEEIIRLDPLEPVHHFRRGVLLQHNGFWASAMQSFRRAQSLQPDSETYEACQDHLLSLDDLQLKQILMLAVEDVPFRVHLSRDPADALTRRGFRITDEALSALSKSLDEPLPTPPPGWRHYRCH